MENKKANRSPCYTSPPDRVGQPGADLFAECINSCYSPSSSDDSVYSPDDDQPSRHLPPPHHARKSELSNSTSKSSGSPRSFKRSVDDPVTNLANISTTVGQLYTDLLSVTTTARAQSLHRLPVPSPPTRPPYRKPEDSTLSPTTQGITWHTPSSSARILFRKRGKIIGSLNFGHLILDLNLRHFVDKANQLCGHEAQWIKSLKESKRQGEQFFEDMIASYETQCKRLLYEIHELEATWLDGELTRQRRVKRQFFITTAAVSIAAGVTALISSLFSSKALLDISMGTSQNPITIRHLQDHEVRITTNERSISLLKEQLERADKAINQNLQEIHLLHILLQVQSDLTTLERLTGNLIDGLQLLHLSRFSPKLIEASQVVPLLNELKEKLAMLGLVSAVSHAQELYGLDASHLIFRNGTIRIIVHVPAYHQSTLMDLREYIQTPISLGTGHFLYPQPHSQFIASNPSNTLFRTYTVQEFLMCRKIGDTYFCPQSTWFRKRFQDNCLINLHLKDSERIRDHCKFVVTLETSFLYQLDHLSFHYYARDKTELVYSCPLTSSKRWEALGTTTLWVQPGCQINSADFLIQGAADVFLDPVEISYHELAILNPEDVLLLKNEFSRLPEKALELVGSSKGLKITDIRSEFAAQERAYHFRLGLIAGCLCLVVFLCCLCLCCKFCPCMSLCKLLFTTKTTSPSTSRFLSRRRPKDVNQSDKNEEIEMLPKQEPLSMDPVNNLARPNAPIAQNKLFVDSPYQSHLAPI